MPYGFFWLLHPYFWVQWSNYGLIFNLGSLYTYKTFEQYLMNHIFSVRWCQRNLVWHLNFRVFGMSICEKLQFHTYMDNMHIKWKLKLFWIYVCHQKVQLGMKTFWKKMNFKIFCFDFQRKKNFKHKFFNIPFSIPPKFYFGMIFNTKKEIYMKDW